MTFENYWNGVNGGAGGKDTAMWCDAMNALQKLLQQVALSAWNAALESKESVPFATHNNRYMTALEVHKEYSKHLWESGGEVNFKKFCEERLNAPHST